jgi:transcriptional regulator with XRE-family HTH domain
MNEIKVLSKERGKVEATELAVGARLKAVRLKSGLSQRELAKRADVTHATVSLIEQESHAPSLASLHRILSAIPISLADFFALPTIQKNVLIYKSEDDLAIIQRGAVDLRALGAERRDKKLQMFHERYEAGADSGEVPYIHDGETAAIVIEGEVELIVDGETHRIGAGGGFQIFSNQPYKIRNAGSIRAVISCSCTPPML